MKILWVINNMLPEMSAYISGGLYDKVSSSNSWTTALFEATKNKLDFSIVMFYNGTKLIDKTFDGVRCFAVPRKKNPFIYDKYINTYLETIKNCVQPDVVHIHGTEYPHSYNVIDIFGAHKVVISIQGLISVIARYYTSGIKTWDILKNLTLRNLIFCDSVFGQQKTFYKRGEWELKTIKTAKYIIGRTEWDKIHSLTINPKIKYFHLDELIRKEFFESRKWNFDECDKHTIFISQSNYPIKGLHMMLMALEIVKREFADVKLKIAGKPFLNHDTLYEKLCYHGYAKYLNYLIKKNKLEKNVEFIGFKDAKGMIDEYLKSNVYVCPSCIENSPNSMCEAQLLGVPSILSFCGGVYDMTNYGESANMYRFEEYEMLAYYICNVFKNSENEYNRIKNGIKIAEKRHNKQMIIEELINIYNEVKNASGY